MLYLDRYFRYPWASLHSHGYLPDRYPDTVAVPSGLCSQPHPTLPDLAKCRSKLKRVGLRVGYMHV
jgi:hypothetical protein